MMQSGPDPKSETRKVPYQGRAAGNAAAEYAGETKKAPPHLRDEARLRGLVAVRQVMVEPAEQQTCSEPPRPSR